MIRLPNVVFARRFFPDANPDAKSGFHRPARLAYAAMTIGFGLAISCCPTFTQGAAAQNAAKGSADHIKAVTSAIDGASIKANTATSKDWPTIGLDYAETRFSKLNQITTDNVKNLGLMWSYNLESVRGVEATPLVVDGIMYVTASWSVVHAVDARTGKRIWSYDPGVNREQGYKGCCDVVNRGVALYKGKVFVGAYDGRLVAIDAVTGKKIWEKDTLIDHDHSYTVTGAPRVVNGKVLIGNGGAEYGARGYITKHQGGEKLMQAIRHVLSGQIYVSEKMSAHILKILSGGQAAPVRSLIAQLSDREFEVFELLGEGVSAHEIARRLHISTKTVDAHRANIKKKLIIKTTSELISYAARWMEHRANME